VAWSFAGAPAARPTPSDLVDRGSFVNHLQVRARVADAHVTLQDRTNTPRTPTRVPCWRTYAHRRRRRDRPAGIGGVHPFRHGPRRFTQPLEMNAARHVAEQWWTSSDVVQAFPDAASVRQFLMWLQQFSLGRKRLLGTSSRGIYSGPIRTSCRVSGQTRMEMGRS
jgi:hypothetical protein